MVEGSTAGVISKDSSNIVSLVRKQYKAITTKMAVTVEASAGCKVRVVRGNAIETMKAMKAEGQKFDIVFLDADKDDYIDYYKLIMDSGGLLNPNGFILADLTMCALLYDATDGRYT